MNQSHGTSKKNKKDIRKNKKFCKNNQKISQVLKIYSEFKIVVLGNRNSQKNHHVMILENIEQTSTHS